MPSASDLTHSSPKSSVCDLSLLAKLQEAEKIHEELAVREALRNNLYWLTRATKTRDEQNPADPYKPFPDKKYIRAIFQFLDEWPGRLKIIEKSRTMMGSWSVSGWTAHFGFTHPATCTVFQSQDERRAVTDVGYVKELWKNSLPALKDRWPLAKSLERQPESEFRLANGSRWIAIARGPDNIRSAHPTIYVADEAAHMEDGEECLDVALAAQPLHIVLLSSAREGYFENLAQGSYADWPFEDTPA